ncbi:endoplasmic reticulum-Golgi intermediate compartment protein 2 [Culicoides brevitarsis]|uniref:endoplasmic reticulum-Golgi intermediate compartment protein 2 n=1 Tax=Culicoides brevitarsis TaxID=469753 RepID=UPI00307B522A
MADTLRQRKVQQEPEKTTNSAIEAVKKLDAFPKIAEDYVEYTTVGGGISILSRIIILILIYTETRYYLEKKLLFKFEPDTDYLSKLKINIDLTVAMPCKSIGADILDSTNQNVFSFGILEEEDTWFELCPNQQMYFDYIQHLNSYLREEYHSIADVLYKGEQQETIYTMPKRTRVPDKPFDACRVHGSLTLNKVSGNFHITAGRSLHFPNGHIHLNLVFDSPALSNFSHRIHRFSFGTHTSGIVHPLEGEEKILTDPSTMMQYYLEVVPTDIQSTFSKVQTFQYSVKENARVVDHYGGSHGIPGLYFKYDMSALKVIVHLDRDNLVQFSVRLCSIIAGIVVISGLVNSFIQFTFRKFLKTISPQLVQHIQDAQRHNLKVNPVPQPSMKPQSNLLIDVGNAAMKSPLLQ